MITPPLLHHGLGHDPFTAPPTPSLVTTVSCERRLLPQKRQADVGGVPWFDSFAFERGRIARSMQALAPALRLSRCEIGSQDC